MNRITENLADLVNDGSDSDEDVTKNNNRNSIIESLERGQKTNSNCRTRYRQVVVIVSLVGIILGSAVAIGYAIIGSGDPNDNVQSSYLTGAQEELEIAERVISACGETNLNKDKSECQTLCHGSMCCFENDDEYGCQDDLSKDCAVYAGCEALIEGHILDGIDEDEE